MGYTPDQDRAERKLLKMMTRRVPFWPSRSRRRSRCLQHRRRTEYERRMRVAWFDQPRRWR